MKKLFLLSCLLCIFLFSIVYSGCFNDDDDDDDSFEPFGDSDSDDDDSDFTNDDGPPTGDDDIPDDDDISDDDDIPDDDDDDDSDGVEPRISIARWIPDPVEYNSFDDYWSSLLMFKVCDPENNLSGGAIYAYITSTDELIWNNPISWDELMDLPDVSDCQNPEDIFIETVFGFGPSTPGWNVEMCIDLEVSDHDDNFSNKLENICVYVP